MSTVHEHDAETHQHPNYATVFFILGLLTLLEVGVTYLPIPRAPFLLTMMVVKAVLVILYYMHLKFDSRWYAVIFLAPIPFVVLIVVALLLA